MVQLNWKLVFLCCCFIGMCITIPYARATGGGLIALILTFILSPIALYFICLTTINDLNTYYRRRALRHRMWHEGKVKSDRVIPWFSRTWGTLLIFLTPIFLTLAARLAHQANRDGLHGILWWLRYPSMPIIFVAVWYYQDFLIPRMVQWQVRKARRWW